MQLTPKQKLVLIWLAAIAIFWLIYLFLRHEFVKPKKVYAIAVALMGTREKGLKSIGPHRPFLASFRSSKSLARFQSHSTLYSPFPATDPRLSLLFCR
jgi:hypothetical protein